ncbi:iron-containing alcohol dehydrogenase [Solidesulfovibrio sp.]|uniref:iron-containing alcohol dehydrogenase n=1 Tax=Solidesulfovibrio sp. TaxID=2910990 RepID=UPI002B1F0A08|nr:iron-containing alcohol dehydrogenase [Solidesulfovibrio sp.]MEA5087439.1 iron-containing alcohol dehydrogenase [Solidesulfovibrio sp.]HML61619.1 iron-containing alcohol dehydrogenase [Solidesulfovibrio sp.]
MRISKFAIPEIIFGRGSIVHLASCAKRLGGRRVLLVSDQGLVAAGWVDRIMEILRDNGLEWIYYDSVNSNPRDYQVHEGAKIYVRERCDVLIAVGGGSPMDAAKGIATIVGNGGRISDYEGANRIMRPLPPMIFLPTTAGSGSDISQFCIITDVERQLKMSIISRSLVPNISIIDPLILLTKSEKLIITSAIDAFAHAVESYVSLLSSPFTEHQAVKAMRLITQNLRPALEDRSIEALENLSIAATAAGMSFSNAGLGVGHSLAHSLGGMFDVLHGLVHPILLPHVMRFNLPASVDKLATIGRIVCGPRMCSSQYIAQAGISWLERFFADFGVSVRLRDILPDRDCLETIAKAAVNDACTLTNPRPATWESLLGVCQEAW